MQRQQRTLGQLIPVNAKQVGVATHGKNRWQSTGVEIWRSVVGAATTPRTQPAVVAIGKFDGVHRGHQYVISQARAVSDGLEVVAVTFDPHPLAVTAPEKLQPQLSDLELRVDLLKKAGADQVYVLAFSAEMAALTPAEFVETILIEQLRTAHVVVGEAFRFGARAAGDVEFLRTYEFGVTGLSLAGGEKPWSSTRVRAALAAGDVSVANEILGREFCVRGVVQPGDARGRDLGYPTANLSIDSKFAVPADGVYAGWADWEGRLHPAAISVGTNPTFGGTERRIEVYVLDETPDLYGKTLKVSFVAHLRGQITFDDPADLIAQMDLDITATKSALGLD